MTRKLIAMSVLAICTSGAFANLLTDGSFEDQNASSWTEGYGIYSHTTQIYYAGPAPAGAGEIYAHTIGIGNTTFSQSVDVSALTGQSLLLTGWMSAYEIADYADISIEYFYDGTVGSLGGYTLEGDTVADMVINADGSDATGWTHYNWTQYGTTTIVPVNALSAVVTAGQGSGNDTYVDLISLDVVPEPGTLGMVAVFGGALAFIRRRLMI